MDQKVNKLLSSIRKLVDNFNSPSIFVHSDLLRSIKFNIPPDNRLLDAHCKLLLGFGKDIYMPTFNYDYTKTRCFNVEHDVSKIGAINEHFRLNYANWRTPVPVFSVAGTGGFPDIDKDEIIDPFNERSVFAYLHKSDALMMYYGASFSSTTILHYIERVSGFLTYRYDKLFPGKVTIDGQENNVVLKLHVRPMGKNLTYDWNRLEEDLTIDNLLIPFINGVTRIKLIRIKDLYNFWIEKIKKDNLYFLDRVSRDWVEPTLDKLGRRFLLSDFE